MLPWLLIDLGRSVTQSAVISLLDFSKRGSFLSDIRPQQWPFPQTGRAARQESKSSCIVQRRPYLKTFSLMGEIPLQALRSGRWETEPTVQFKDSKDHLKYLLTPFGSLTFMWTSKKSVSKHKQWNRVTTDLTVDFFKGSLDQNRWLIKNEIVT